MYNVMNIIGFGNYTIDADGTIISLERLHPRWRTIIKDKPKVMKPSMSGKKRNYLSIRLTNLEGISKVFKVHRLVAEAFIPNPENKPQINHIDGDTTNNKVSNLEWCTNSENQLHAYRTGLKFGMSGKDNPAYGKPGVYKNKRGADHNRSTRVVQLGANGTVIAGYESGILAAESVGGNSSNIMKACRGLIKKSAGFAWCFPSDDHKYLFKECMQQEV
jgi:hypothetical protein